MARCCLFTIFSTRRLWAEKLKELECKQVHILESLAVHVVVFLIVVAGFFIVVVVVDWVGGFGGGKVAVHGCQECMSWQRYTSSQVLGAVSKVWKEVFTTTLSEE